MKKILLVLPVFLFVFSTAHADTFDYSSSISDDGTQVLQACDPSMNPDGLSYGTPGDDNEIQWFGDDGAGTVNLASTMTVCDPNDLDSVLGTYAGSPFTGNERYFAAYVPDGYSDTPGTIGSQIGPSYYLKCTINDYITGAYTVTWATTPQDDSACANWTPPGPFTFQENLSDDQTQVIETCANPSMNPDGVSYGVSGDDNEIQWFGDDGSTTPTLIATMTACDPDGDQPFSISSTTNLNGYERYFPVYVPDGYSDTPGTPTSQVGENYYMLCILNDEDTTQRSIIWSREPQDNSDCIDNWTPPSP